MRVEGGNRIWDIGGSSSVMCFDRSAGNSIRSLDGLIEFLISCTSTRPFIAEVSILRLY